MTEEEMVGWYHRLNRYESEQTPGDSEGRGSLARCIHGVTVSEEYLCVEFSHYSPKSLEF